MSSFFHEKKRGKDKPPLIPLPEETVARITVVIIYIVVAIFILDYFWPIVVGILASYLAFKFISRKNIKIAVICLIALATVLGSMGWLNKVQNDNKVRDEQNALVDAQRAIDQQKHNEEKAKQDAADQVAKTQADAQAKEQMIGELTPVCVSNHKSLYKPKIQELLDGTAATPQSATRKQAYTSDECKQIITGLQGKGYDSKEIQRVAEAKFGVGMEAKLLYFSIGLPNDYSNSTTTIFGTSSQLVYGDPLNGADYIYIDNGKVSSYQQ